MRAQRNGHEYESRSKMPARPALWGLRLGFFLGSLFAGFSSASSLSFLYPVPIYWVGLGKSRKTENTKATNTVFDIRLMCKYCTPMAAIRRYKSGRATYKQTNNPHKQPNKARNPKPGRSVTPSPTRRRGVSGTAVTDRRAPTGQPACPEPRPSAQGVRPEVREVLAQLAEEGLPEGVAKEKGSEGAPVRVQAVVGRA